MNPEKWDEAINKAKSRVDEYEKKLHSARSKLAKQKPYKAPSAVKRIPDTVVLEARTRVHGKISEAENDNVGVEASHRGERCGERTIGSTSRAIRQRIRTHPARRVQSLEKKFAKAQSKLRFEQMAKEYPDLSKKAARNAMKKQYQKKTTAKMASVVKTMATRVLMAVKRMARAVMNLIKSNPKVMLVVVICIVLIIVIVLACMVVLTLLSNTIGGVIGASTYPSETEEMLAAEDYYAELEIRLQYELDNYQELHPDYDEYVFYLDEIAHDPYVLISFLSVWHEGQWLLIEVEDTLLILFERQYVLTETVEMEVRYQIETISYSDPDTGEIVTAEIEVAYEYFICVVTLQNNGLSNVAVSILDGDQLAWYTLYMATLGNRPDLFPIDEYPYASTYE